MELTDEQRQRIALLVQDITAVEQAHAALLAERSVLACDLRAQGVSVKELAAAFGRSPQRFSKVVEGVLPPRRRPRKMRVPTAPQRVGLDGAA